MLVLGFTGLAWASLEAGSLRSIFLLASAIVCGYIYQVRKIQATSSFPVPPPLKSKEIKNKCIMEKNWKLNNFSKLSRNRCIPARSLRPRMYFVSAVERIKSLSFSSCQCPPFRLSYHGLGEPLCFAAFGPFATTAFYFSQGSARYYNFNFLLPRFSGSFPALDSLLGWLFQQWPRSSSIKQHGSMRFATCGLHYDSNTLLQSLPSGEQHLLLRLPCLVWSSSSFNGITAAISGGWRCCCGKNISSGDYALLVHSWTKQIWKESWGRRRLFHFCVMR